MASENTDKLSSDNLLAILGQAPGPIDLRTLSKELSLLPGERVLLKQRVRRLVDEGLVFIDDKRRVRLAQHMPEVCMAEVIAYDDDGYGALKILSQDIDEAMIARSEISLMPERKRGRIPQIGARILARMVQYGPDQYEARVLRILPTRQDRFFGRIVHFRGGFGIEGAEKGARRITELARGGEISVKLDDLVEAEMNDAKGKISRSATVITNFGPADSAQAFIQMAIAEFDIPHHFSDEILTSTQNAKVPALGTREDLRNIPLVTIDGADAKDFDDAVFAEPHGTGWRIIVAIADVSAYVETDSPLDKEAAKRGNSVYLPGTVVPMLPEALSNGMCSLVPNEDRASLAVEIVIDGDGIKQSHRFIRALIKSHARLTYDAVQTLHEGTADERDIGAPDGAIHHLFGAWHTLNKAREKRGTLNLNVPEKRVSLTDAGQPASIDVRIQNNAHRLIEEFMILANICAAEELESRGQICVYRTHDRPDMEKIEGLQELAEALDIPFAKGQVISPHRFNQLLDKVKDTPQEQMVNDAVLRCQSRAVYDYQNKGHYGLSLTRYAHFTSPIRRYADLLVHRALIQSCGLGDERQSIQDLEQMGQICAQISQTEQTAAKAERRTTDRLIACLYHPQIGRQLDVTITGLTNFGIFASFDDRSAEGFMPFRSLPEDFYELSDGNSRLVGRRRGTVFALGAELTAKIESVETASGGILLTFLDGGTYDKQVITKRRSSGSKNSFKSSPKSSKGKAKKGKSKGTSKPRRR